MRPRSLFWPFVLVATGIIWLLISIGTLQTANLWALVYIWPYLLIVLGIGLLVRARWHNIGYAISALVVIVALVAILFAGSLGWTNAPSWCNNANTGFPWCTVNLNMGGAVRGSGEIISEARTLDEFSSVSVDYPAEITIKQGNTQSVTITTDDNLMPQLETQVSGGELHIQQKNLPFSQRVNPSKAVQITLIVKDLTHISFPSAGTLTVDGLKTDSLSVDTSGAGKITLTDLNLQTLSADLSGAGDIEASGTAQNLDLNISGVGSFNGQDLATTDAGVTVSGVGNATLWVTHHLTANISGVGSINYYGSPNVSSNVSGLGKVTQSGNK